MSIIRFDTLRQFMDSLPVKARHDYQDRYGPMDHWSGGLSVEQTRVAVWSGDNEALEKSTRILEKVEADGLELAVSQWENAVTGAIPCVPSYLGGDPESMMQLVETTSDVAPIRIVSDMFISCGFSKSELIERGTMILALVRKLQMIRPVELCISLGTYNEKRTKFISYLVKLDAAPLDLKTLSFVFGHPSFTRMFSFEWVIHNGAGRYVPYCDDTARYLRNAGDIGEKDLFIDAAILNRDSLANPVKWVNDQVKKYANEIDT